MPKVLATDLDGTLFYPKRKIHLIAKKNRAVLQRHHHRKGKIILVTGRNVPFVQKTMRKIGFETDMIACSGAYVKAGSRVLKDQTLSRDEALSIFQTVADCIPTFAVSAFPRVGKIHIYYHHAGFLLSFLFSMIYYYQGTYAEPKVSGYQPFMKKMMEGEVYKLVFYFGVGKKGKALARKAQTCLEEKFENMEIAREGNLLEIVSPGCNKAEGLRLLSQYEQFSLQDLVVVGDSWNDVPMFAICSESYCMQHAEEDVKKQANHTIQHFIDIETHL